MSADTAVPSAMPPAPGPERKFLSKADVKARGAIKVEDIYCPMLDGWFKVAGLSMHQRTTLRKANMTMPEDGDGKPVLDLEGMELDALILGVRDPNNPAIPYFSIGDREWLREQVVGGAITPIANRVFELSGLGGAAAKKPGKSSEPTQS